MIKLFQMVFFHRDNGRKFLFISITSITKIIFTYESTKNRIALLVNTDYL